MVNHKTVGCTWRLYLLRRKAAFVALFCLILSACSLGNNALKSSSGSSSESTCPSNGITTGPCTINSAGVAVSTTFGSNITSWSNATADTTVEASIPDGFYTGRSVNLTEPNLLAANIANGKNIFGVVGTYGGNFASATASCALRDPGTEPTPYLTTQTTSNQISLEDEVTTYGDSDLPTTGGYNYRDIPDVTKDDEGYLGTSCKYAPRPTTDCGTSQGTIADRIADCEDKNGVCSDSSSTTKSDCTAASATWTSYAEWNGATQCNGGQGSWKLVTRSGANKEVWQDQRTGLLWSSIVSSGVNWCQATGNTDQAPVALVSAYNNSAGTPIVGNGTIGDISGGSSSVTETITITFTNATTFSVSGGNCGGGSISSGGLTTTPGSTVTWSRANYCSFTITQGATNFAANDKFILASTVATYSCETGGSLQSSPPTSYCAESPSHAPPAGETWTNGGYVAAKGGLGAETTPSVRWRVPSLDDYLRARLNGILFVMPDMGLAGSSRPNIDSSPGSTAPLQEWAATINSNVRARAWYFSANNGNINSNNRDQSLIVRCVGRYSE